MIVAGPDVPQGETRQQTVGLVDIYPTLLELAGLPANPVNEGHSLAPILRDAGMVWDHPAISQWRRSRGDQAIQFGPWRYSLYGDGSEELYNHETDPNEWTNLAADADSERQHRKLMDSLKSQLPAGFFEETKNSQED